MDTDQSILDAGKQSGKSLNTRKRKKQYYNRIRQQMEFYFGDANLSKDRFLNKLLAVNPYVSLDVFMSFNKIKELASSIEEIQKAIESSEMLELSSDRQSVRRTTEVIKKDDIDEYMVYVEALPPKATHETVKQLFKQFGNVAYVSLPKYRTSGRIKEFAFIEFEDKCSVEKCINAFRQFDGVIGVAQDVENLTSVVSYVKEQEEIENDDKEKPEQSNEEHENKTEAQTKCDNEAKIETENDHKSGTKRPNEEAASSDTGDLPPKKRTKTEESEEELEEDTQDNNLDEKASVVDNNQDGKKKKRRRRKRNLSISIINIESGCPMTLIPNHGDDVKTTDDPVQSIVNLRVATKVEWKRLRNKFLTLQRQKYSEVKKLLRSEKHDDNGKISTLPLSTIRPVTMKNKKFASPPPAKKICTRNINFYGAIRDEQNTNTYECSIIDETKPHSEKTKDNKEKNEKPFAKDVQFEFEPGLIVKVNFDAPCADIVDFKAEMKQYSFVRYTDIKEGQTSAFVRVDSPRSAPVLIKHCAPNRCQILAGESETEYWAKIAKDREQKLSKNVKVPKNRTRKMRNLIKNIAEVNVVKTIDNKTTISHIRFDDD